MTLLKLFMPKFLRLALFVFFVATVSAKVHAEKITSLSQVGFAQMEFVTNDTVPRRIAFTLFYPADSNDTQSSVFKMPLYTGLQLYKNRKPLSDPEKRPLIVFSHGRGSNPFVYAWFMQYLAARGYIVAAIYHHQANSFDSNIIYQINKLWQRPVDISLMISHLLNHSDWKNHIDSNKIGVAGHSQGGFTTLWLGGAKVNAKKFLAFQNIPRQNEIIPDYLRKQMDYDAKHALHLKDNRIKAVFAMAPGEVETFGMDANGLKSLNVPAYLIVGAGDTQTPAQENAGFAAKYIPKSTLHILHGRVDHEIFVNECTSFGKDQFPESCYDHSSVNRSAMHEEIGKAALQFFDSTLQVKKK